MERFAYDRLIQWKAKKNRKPLIIRGARQVGKTWLMKEFAKNEYRDFAYINFENNPKFGDIFKGNSVFGEFKGALTEQYVLQQLTTGKNWSIYYWSSENYGAEIDFLLQYRNVIVPVEVKAEENLQAESLKSFVNKYKSQIALRMSMSDFREEENLTNLPLYVVGALKIYMDTKIV